MGHYHHTHDEGGDRSLLLATLLNVFITVVEIPTAGHMESASLNIGFNSASGDGKLRLSELSSLLSIMTFTPSGILGRKRSRSNAITEARRRS